MRTGVPTASDCQTQKMAGDGDYKKTSESSEVYLELRTGMEAVAKEDAILELAIEYVLTNGYPPPFLEQGQKACRAATLVVENDEVFVQKRNGE